jgi:hypothetical protein
MVAEQDQGLELPERWSAKAKSEVVLRLARGEAVDVLSREIAVPAHELEALAAGVPGRWDGGAALAGRPGGAGGAQEQDATGDAAEQRAMQVHPGAEGAGHGRGSW